MIKWLRILGVALLLGLGLSIFMKLNPGLIGHCSASYIRDQDININGHIFAAEVAKTNTQLEKGLGDRKCIGPDEAMLFEFDKSGSYEIWMKQMHFSIDVVWVSPDKKVVEVKTHLSPDSYPHTYTNDYSHPAQYVIELKAGTVDKLKIKSGTSITF